MKAFMSKTTKGQERDKNSGCGERERVKMTERIPGGAGGSRRMKEFKVKREV